MPIRSPIRTASLAALIFAAALAPQAPAPAADVHRQHAGDPGGGERRGLPLLPLGVGKSVVIDLPRDIKDVLVADPKIANAVVRSSRRAYMIGVKVGQTNIFFFDAKGHQIAGFDIAVKRDLNGMRAALKRVLPDADIQVEGMGADGSILSGTAASPPRRNRPTTSPRGSVGDKGVVNAITVEGATRS